MKQFQQARDVGIESFHSGASLLKMAISSEKTDLYKSIQLYNQARSKFFRATCQRTLDATMLAKANEALTKCTKRIHELMIFFEQNPNYMPIQQEQQQPTSNLPLQKKGSKNSFNVQPQQQFYYQQYQRFQQQQFSPQQNQYYQKHQQQFAQQQHQAFQQHNQVRQFEYPTVSQDPMPSSPQKSQQIPQQDSPQKSQQIPQQSSPQKSQQIPQQDSPQKSQQIPQQNSPRSSLRNSLASTIIESIFLSDAKNSLKKGVILDTFGFHIIASMDYDDARNMFSDHITFEISDQDFSESYISIIDNRIKSLSFYKNHRKDIEKYCFLKGCMAKYNDISNDYFEICKVALGGDFMSDIINKIFSSDTESESKENIIRVVVPEKIGNSLSKQYENEVQRIFEFPTAEIKHFILLYGLFGINLNKIIELAALSANVQNIYIINFLDFLLTNENPGDVIQNLFKQAQSSQPSFIVFENVESLFYKDSKSHIEQSVKEALYTILQTIETTKVTIFCTSNLPWDISPDVYNRFEKKIYYKVPPVDLINDIIKINLKVEIYNDGVEFSPNIFEGYTENDISDVICEALISSGMKSTGKTCEEFLSSVYENRNSIFSLNNNSESNIENHIIRIPSSYIIAAKDIISPYVLSVETTIFDVFVNNS